MGGMEGGEEGRGDQGEGTQMETDGVWVPSPVGTRVPGFV